MKNSKKLKNQKVINIVITLLLVILSVGCGKELEPDNIVTSEAIIEPEVIEIETQEIQYPITVIDQIGREVVIEKPSEKIVSSYYISTALLIALGVEDNVVGIEMKADTREIYHLAAPQFLELPQVGSGKGINIEEVASLQADLVIIPKRLQESVESFEALNIPVLVVNPENMKDFEECVSLLGIATGSNERAMELLGYYDEKILEVEEMVSGVSERPSVYLSAGGSYLTTCTSKMYIHDAITMAGGINASSDLTDGYWSDISAEQLLKWNPEYMLVVNYADYAPEDILAEKTLSEINAIKNNKVLQFPSQIEPWDQPTASSILGILWLAQTLHPEEYSKEKYIEEVIYFYDYFFDIDIIEEQL